MTDTVETIVDRQALVLDPHGATLDPGTLASDLISLAWEHEADILAVTVERLPSEFFALRTGVLGDVAQKLANYRVQMVVLGDISRNTASSNAFRDYVGETNAGNSLWFLVDMDALEVRLQAVS